MFFLRNLRNLRFSLAGAEQLQKITRAGRPRKNHLRSLPMPRIKRIDHVAVVVADLDEATAFWQDALGLPIAALKEEPAEKAVVAFLPVNGSEIELVKPTAGDSGTAKFLAKRGPGMHHLCLEVEDLDGMLARLKARGVRLIHDEPVEKPNGVRYAFVHPKSAHGVLVELYEKPA